jgi:hypothetical protein
MTVLIQSGVKAGCLQFDVKPVERISTPPSPGFRIIDILQDRQRWTGLPGSEIGQRIRQGMLRGPSHLLEDIGWFGWPSPRSHQPVAAIARRTEDELMPVQHPERLLDVVALNVRDIAADHYHRSRRQPHRRAAHRPSHPLAQVSATLGEKFHAGMPQGQAAPIRCHRHPGRPSEVAAKPPQQRPKRHPLDKRHPLEVYGGHGADPACQPPLAPAQPEFTREDYKVSLQCHDPTYP